jgi:hypothetical protein
LADCLGKCFVLRGFWLNVFIFGVAYSLFKRVGVCMANLGLNRWKVSTLVLIVALVTVSFLALYKFEANAPYVAAEPSFIEVSVEGPKKLGVNETGTYQAVINSAVSGDLSFSWSISPLDNCTVLEENGGLCNLTFVSATQEPYLLSVQVKDLTIGNLGSSSVTVYDPYTSPSLYLNSFGAPYSYLVESDGLGWYRAINGQTGAVSWTSTNATSVFSQVGAAAATLVQGQTCVVKSGSYTFTTGLVWNYPVNLIGENAYLGTKFIAGADGMQLLTVGTYGSLSIENIVFDVAPVVTTLTGMVKIGTNQVSMQNCIINGEGKATTNLEVADNSYYNSIDHVRVLNAKTQNILFGTSANGNHITKCFIADYLNAGGKGLTANSNSGDNSVRDTNFENMSAQAISMRYVQGWVFDNVYVEVSNIADLVSFQDAANIKLLNSYLGSDTAVNQIRLQACSWVTIDNCKLYAQTGNAVIRATGSCSYIYVTHNSLESGNLWSDDGTTTYKSIHYNKGFNTESSGTITVTGGTGTITHGLAGTPTWVTYGNNNGGVFPELGWQANSTVLVIWATGAANTFVSYYAEYNP